MRPNVLSLVAAIGQAVFAQVSGRTESADRYGKFEPSGMGAGVC